MSSKRVQQPEKKAQKRTPWYRQPITLGATVGGIVIIGLIVLTMLFSRPAENSQTARPVGQDYLPELGDSNAPTTIYEYADFQCPACSIFERQYRSRIEEDYIKPGKARLIYRNFTVVGQESIWAAEAAYCAAEQGGFWAYHDKLFASQQGENRGAFSKPNLIRFARELKLKEQDFQTCLESGRYKQKVQDEKNEGEQKGIKATPSFIISGQIVQGVDYLRLRELIENDLSR